MHGSGPSIPQGNSAVGSPKGFPHEQHADKGADIQLHNLDLHRADSPVHVPISPQPPCYVRESPTSTGKLLPGRQRILASAARQLAATEMLVEGLDVCAVDINTHALPPPSASCRGPQQQGSLPDSSPHRRHSLELLRLHALLQAAVGEGQDLVVVGLHQVATQYRRGWAACVAAAFAAAEGQAVTAIRTHLLGPQASSAADASSAASAATAASRGTSFANYVQIVPLDACPHHNQMLLVYVHPSHLSKVTLLSIAKSRLGTYCCRELQHNYRQQWGLSTSLQRRLLQQWERQKATEEQKQRQERMDLLFNFNTFFGLTSSSPVAATSVADAGASAEAKAEPESPNESQADTTPRTFLELWGFSKNQKRRHQRITRQRLNDRICCNTVCSLQPRNSCSVPTQRRSTHGGSSNETESRSKSSTTACGCEVFQEVFAYGGMAAQLLIGATPVVVACVDLKLTEDLLEPCGAGVSCRFCHTSPHPHEGTTSAAQPGATSYMKSNEVAEQEAIVSAVWRRRVIRAVQRQQLLTILADLRFETDSGWASALELKPMLLLGARRQRGIPATAVEVQGAAASKERSPPAASGDQQRRLNDLQQLGICSVEDNRFFFCRVPQREGSTVLSVVESGRAAEWRRPAWSRLGSQRGWGSVARFWLKWMSCRLLVDIVDTERVKKQCNELRRTLKQEGRCLSKLLVDPPLLQLPPVRPFEPMQLKICLSNPHESLPTAYAVYCLSDSGKSIVPLSHVSYWHGAFWRKWDRFSSENKSLSASSSKDFCCQSSSDSQEQQKQRELLKHEQRRLQNEALRESIDKSRCTASNNAGRFPGEEDFGASKEANVKAVLRRRIRLERWLLMDSLHGFLKGGETRVLSMTLNIQEGIYSAHELACCVLVLRLVDSRQDFFCCLAASLMPALLGAELQPLAVMGDRPLLSGDGASAPKDDSADGEQDDMEQLTRSETQKPGQLEAGEMSATYENGAGDLQGSVSQLPLPKELWWLLMHVHAKTVEATSVAVESTEWSGDCVRHRGRHHPKWDECETHRKKSCDDPVLENQGSLTSSRSKGSLGSISSSGDSSQGEGEYSAGSCCTDQLDLSPPGRGQVQTRGGLGLDIAVFLCTAGGETLTWPSFLAGADTYLQPKQRLPEFSGVCQIDSDPQTLSQRYAGSSSHMRQRAKQGVEKGNSSNSSTEEAVAACEDYHDAPLKRDVAFLRACLEKGIAIPQGVSLCAALMLLEQWGATCCFFPSEFAVQDVQTDNLHLICRAVLLSLPTVHRNAFISVVSAIDQLLKSAVRNVDPCTEACATNACRERRRLHEEKMCHSTACGKSNLGSGSASLDNSTDWVGCCPEGKGPRGAECGKICLEVLKSGEQGGLARRANCLECLRTPQLLRHALLLWVGAWLMRSCRPALRHAVLDHFISMV